MTARLIGLYARSRRGGWLCGVIVVAAVARWVVRTWVSGPSPFAMLLWLMLVTVAATVVAGGLAGPFGQVELSAGNRLPSLRIGQVVGTVVLAAAGFAVAVAIAGSPVVESIRDLAGFIGIALLTGRLVGAHRCWTVPIGYALVCAGEIDLGEQPAWAWPIQPAGDVWALVTAGVLLVAGVVVAARPVPDSYA